MTRIRIGKRLKALRIASGEDMSSLARKVGTSRWTWMRWEDGRSSIPLETLPALCEELSASLVDLFPSKECEQLVANATTRAA